MKKHKTIHTVPMKVAGSLIIYGIPRMHEQGRRNIVNWLRLQARHIAESPQAYSETFRARYLYESHKSNAPRIGIEE